MRFRHDQTEEPGIGESLKIDAVQTSPLQSFIALSGPTLGEVVDGGEDRWRVHFLTVRWKQAPDKS